MTGTASGNLSIMPKLTFFRIVMGLGLLALPLAFGGLARSPWLILPLSIVFAIAYGVGKGKQWRAYIRMAGAAGIVKGLALTLLIQLILVSLFFFVAYGIVSIFVPRPFAQAITIPEMAILAAAAVLSIAGATMSGAAETLPETTVENEPAHDDVDDEGDLVMSNGAITLENFFAGRHFSVPDHMEKALARWNDGGGAKVERVPVVASEAMIRKAEERLDVTLPQTLRGLYLRRDGGALPSYWVPATADPGTDFDDWIDAFAYDYNDLRPLKDLHFLIDDYMENFDPDYDDEADKEGWFPGADRLVVLTRRYGVATLLDYRQGAAEPGVLLIDLDQGGDAPLRKSYDTFDAFFSDLRMEGADRQSGGRASSDRRDRSRLADRGYDGRHPQQFWADDNANAVRGVSDEEWQTAEARLGVRLPAAFRSLYAVLDGGRAGYPFHPRLGVDERGEPRSPFPGRYSEGALLPLLTWVSLAELSERLSFPEATPYAQLHESPERLIVVSASFDSALMLDYRGRDEPLVLHCPDLTRSETCVDLAAADVFLEALRQRANPLSNDSLPIADRRLTPRVAAMGTFWMPGAKAVGATDDTLAEVAERFGAEMPHGFVPLLKAHNGGRVRFRFAPPLAGSRNPLTGPQPDRRNPEWVDVFPGGIWPVEDWIGFSEFRRRHDVARDQDPREDLMPEMRSEPDVEERLIVIGADAPAAITLLDLSTGSFRKSTGLSRADYSSETDQYRLAVAPTTIHHCTHGAFMSLRARMDEIE